MTLDSAIGIPSSMIIFRPATKPTWLATDNVVAPAVTPCVRVVFAAAGVGELLGDGPKLIDVPEVECLQAQLLKQPAFAHDPSGVEPSAAQFLLLSVDEHSTLFQTTPSWWFG